MGTTGQRQTGRERTRNLVAERADERRNVPSTRRNPASGQYPALRRDELTVGRVPELGLISFPPEGGFHPTVLSKLPIRDVEVPTTEGLDSVEAWLGTRDSARAPVTPVLVLLSVPRIRGGFELAELVSSVRAAVPAVHIVALARGGRLPTSLRTDARALEIDLLDQRTSRAAVRADIVGRSAAALRVRRQALQLGADLGLSKAKREVLLGLAHGVRREHMARVFRTSPATIKTHITRLYSAVGAHSEPDLLRLVHAQCVRPVSRPSARRRRGRRV